MLTPSALPCSRIATFRFLFAVLLLFGATSSMATDYFVREAGDDATTGTTTNTAWRTVERVNRTNLEPGDRVLFEAGQKFAGNLLLSAEDAGTSNAPVVIGSFGQGRATLLAGTKTGITVESAGGILIRDLVIVGAGRTNNTGNGILCDNRRPSREPLDYLRIENADMSGFGFFGILITGLESGYRHVRVTHCTLRDNLRGGMEVAGRLSWDAKHYAHHDVQVTHCRAFGNTGDPNYLKNHSGSGIVLYQVDGGLMDNCLAWNNGALCRSPGGGGVGLWTCASRRVVIQHCESFANKTSAADGGGFDIDGGSEECVLQYNYSHDNDGPGLMVYTYPNASYSDRANVVRFNISENDSRRGKRYAGLWVRSDGAGMRGVEVYNNTVLIGPWTEQAAYVHGTGVEARFRNNIFIGKGGALPLRIENPETGVRFENNLYWRDGLPFEIKWGEHAFASLAEWRQHSGQETFDGRAIGYFEDPKLSSHPAGIRAGEHIGLSALQAFHPMAGSLVSSGGLDLNKRLGLQTGSRDLLGQTLPDNGQFPLGSVIKQLRQ